MTQYFSWEGLDFETVFKDIVTFTINGKSIADNLPKTELNSPDTIKKAVILKSIFGKNFNLRKDKQIQSIAPTSLTPWLNYTYNRDAAASYARKYAITPNSSYYTFTDNDCTNFVSQALYAGGVPMRKQTQPYENSPNWWIQSGSGGQFLYAVPWVNANSFYLTLRGSTTFRTMIGSVPSSLDIGDVISYDRNNDYVINHNAIVTYIDDTRPQDTIPYVSYHSTNRLNVAWDFYIKNTPDPVTPYFTILY